VGLKTRGAVFPFGDFAYLQLPSWLSPVRTVPLMRFTWTTEALSEDRRAVLVELSLFAVFLQV
jgi:hypothetical protein